MYEESIKLIRDTLSKFTGNVLPDYTFIPQRHSGKDFFLRIRLIEHLLWMMDEIEEMTDIVKASRWIGWVYRSMETIPLPLLSNEDIRDVAKIDSKNIKDTKWLKAFELGKQEGIEIGMAMDITLNA